MGNEFEEVINQMGNLVSSLESFSEKDSKSIQEDSLRKEFVRQQKASNKLAFDLGKLKSSFEEKVSSFAVADDEETTEINSAARFASISKVLGMYKDLSGKQI